MLPIKVLKTIPVTRKSSQMCLFIACAVGVLVGCTIGVASSVSYYALTDRSKNHSIAEAEEFSNQTSIVAERKTNRSLLLFMGDSLTERGERSEYKGWITQLRTKYSRSIDVISRGFSGYNTKWYIQHGLPRVEQDLEAYPTPALITIWLGANDETLLSGSAAAQHVPVNDYRTNLFTIIERLRAKVPGVNIMLITPPTVDNERRRSKSGVLDRSNEQAGLYAAACVEQAGVANVSVLNLYSHFNAMNESKRNEYFFDGLHFNAAGNEVVSQQLVEKIASEFPLLAHAITSTKFPEWSTLAKRRPDL